MKWKQVQRRARGCARVALMVGALLACGASPASPQPGAEAVSGPSSTQIVVTLRREALQSPRMQDHLTRHGRRADPRPALAQETQAAARQWNVSRMRPAFSSSFLNPALASRLGLDRAYVVEVPQGTNTTAMAEAWRALRDDIESASVDTIGGVADFFPNDTNFGVQYALHNTGQSGGVTDADMDAPEAWGLHTGDFGTVTIAIIDSGVNSHPELGVNSPPFPNGRFVEGRNTNDPFTPTLTTDGCPHGTHVAGIAAAAGNNGIGVAGVTWGAYIMPVRVLNGCFGTVSQLADGIVWAADHGADVANMSLQYYGLTAGEETLLQNAIDYAHGVGMILIAATGNDRPAGTVAYPARLGRCMAVSGTTDDDLLATPSTTSPAWSSNYGPQVDVCAPAHRIYSTWTSNSYTYLYGTSMATPHVSGLAALIKSYLPDLSNEDIEGILTSSADDLGPAGWDMQYGHGRANAFSALMLASGAERPPSPLGDGGTMMSRGISFMMPSPTTAGPAAPYAVRVRLTSLHHPDPPNAACCPAPDFSAFESEDRWVGPPRGVAESNDDPSAGSFIAAELQCEPHYRNDWSAFGPIHVAGAEIVPSSQYLVHTVYDTGIVSLGSAMVSTARWGDIVPPFIPPAASQPDGIDIVSLVNKFKGLSGAPSKAVAQLQPNVPDLNVNVLALDITECVNAFKSFAYGYSGLCACPSTVSCNATACTSNGDCGKGMCVQTCIGGSKEGLACHADRHCRACTGGANNGAPCLADSDCPDGTCPADGTCNPQGHCRDACGRCTP